jgi:hypothetical protein
MIKKLLLLLVLAVLVAIGIKGYTSYAAKQFVEHIKFEHQKKLSLTYDWVSADFDGNIHLEGVVITPFSFKRAISIEHLTLGLGGLGRLIASFNSLAAGRLESPVTMNYQGLSMPLKGRGIDEWLALYVGDKALALMDLYSCDERSYLDFSALRAMGIDEIRATGNGVYEQSGGQDSLYLAFDINKIGKLELGLGLSLESINLLLQEGDLSESSLMRLELSYQDAGYYRRLTNLCTSRSGMDVGDYADLSAKQWRLKMAQLGILVDEKAESLYKDRMIQGGILELALNPENPITLNGIDRLLDKELVKFLGLSASLNGKNRSPAQVFLDGQSFRPPPAKETVESEAESSGATVVLNRSSFKLTELEALPDLVERKVRILLNDGKSYQGLLKSANEKKIEVSLIFGSGTADYSFAIEKIQQVEVWR